MLKLCAAQLKDQITNGANRKPIWVDLGGGTGKVHELIYLFIYLLLRNIYLYMCVRIIDMFLYLICLLLFFF